MKQIALLIEQMQKLESLGLDISDASMMYVELDENEEFQVSPEEGYSLEYHWQGSKIPKMKILIPTYTLSDILEKLNKIKEFEVLFNISSHTIKAVVYDYEGIEETFKSFTNNSLLEAAYNMLLWLIENNYIKINKV